MYNSGSDLHVCFPAGVAFYSISDIADRLLSTPAHPMPSLEEGYWLSRCSSDPSGILYSLLEELSPAAMAAFDLACCHCQLWKTSRQLLDTAERRLNSSLEAGGIEPEFNVGDVLNMVQVIEQVYSNMGDWNKTNYNVMCLLAALHRD